MLSEQEAERLLSFSEDDIFMMVGSTIDSSLGTASKSREEIISQAKRWFDERYVQLKKTICPHPIIMRLLKSHTSDEVSIATGIAGILTPDFHPVAAAGIAVLIVRRGCHSFCEEPILE